MRKEFRKPKVGGLMQNPALVAALKGSVFNQANVSLVAAGVVGEQENILRKKDEFDRLDLTDSPITSFARLLK